MEEQITQLASFLEKWAASSVNPGADVLTWYCGEMRIPHPEWGPSDAIYQALLRMGNPLDVRKKLKDAVAAAISLLAARQDWRIPEQEALLELLRSCVDLAPDSDLQTAVQKLLAHEKSCTDPLMISAIRQALIYNQDDDSLKTIWFGLLSGEKYACLLPAPLSDIKGACRLGFSDNPALPAIAKAIHLFSAQISTSQERRPLMHVVWKDLAQTWSKQILDAEWGWTLIQQGRTAGWEKWVFETLPCLYGKVPGSENEYFVWELSAEAFNDLMSIHVKQLDAPVWVVSWKKADVSKTNAILSRIERRRCQFEWSSSRGLKGIVFDEAARITAVMKLDNTMRHDTEIASVPSYDERWQSSKGALCKAL